MSTIRTTDQLGTALRSARKQLRLTQPQLALAAGVGTRFIVDLEVGKPTVRLEHVLRVIDALGGELQLAGLSGAVPENAVGQAVATAKGKRHGA
ncbi:helix-turn-helix transcriptional regulator [Comamonas sp. GB3 AK4-5]|uniref:helix-turn-helix transcriptional regulator n=1 Tax=Comamonas sp. GB3 AK4-5 TaxID=3231487 RepID=UPI00351DD94F